MPKPSDGSVLDDLSRFRGLNAACPDHGKRNHGNLTVPARYGPHKTRVLRCSTWKDRFSERKGTPLFDARLPADKVVSVLAPVADGIGTRETARLVGVHRDTVTRYIRRAGEHAHDLHEELVAFSPRRARSSSMRSGTSSARRRRTATRTRASVATAGIVWFSTPRAGWS